MRLSILLLTGLLAGCAARPTAEPPTVTVSVQTRVTSPAGIDDLTLDGRTRAPSPDGRASLSVVYGPRADVPRVRRVLLAAEGDTTEVFAWEFSTALGLEWPAADLGRVWVPVGGNDHHASVFVEPSSRRVSPPLDDDIAVDGAAGTVVTFDAEAFTLRDLWSGEALAAWKPPGIDLVELRHECDTGATLSGRTARLRYECGDGPKTLDMEWN